MIFILKFTSVILAFCFPVFLKYSIYLADKNEKSSQTYTILASISFAIIVYVIMGLLRN